MNIVRLTRKISIWSKSLTNFKFVRGRPREIVSKTSLIRLFVEDLFFLLSIILLPICVVLRLSRLRFIKLDFDHFGQIIFLDAWLSANHNDFRGVILGYHYPNRELLTLYSKNVFVINNPWVGIFLAPFFFSPVVNSCANPQLSAKISQKLIDAIEGKSSFFRKNIISASKRYPCFHDIVRENTILFFNREPGWEHSISHSQRNLSLSRSVEIVNHLLKRGFRVHRIGGNNSTPIGLKHSGFSESLFSEISPSQLYEIGMSAKAIIGSPSGGTVVPSFLCELPALYLDMPLASQPFWQTGGERLAKGDIFLCQNLQHEDLKVHAHNRIEIEEYINESVSYEHADLGKLCLAVDEFINFFVLENKPVQNFDKTMREIGWNKVKSNQNDRWGVYQVESF